MIALIPPVRNLNRAVCALVVTFVALVAVATPAQPAASREEAIKLYNAGQYSEARPILERLIQEGDDGGIMLYRLYFCQRSAGDAAQRATLEKARAALERDVAKASTFEAGFYLANSYANLGMEAQLPSAAERTTRRFEAGEIAEPTEPLEQFRLGKLYADQKKDDLAQPWYERAVEQFVAADGGGQKAYLEWGARWLGQRAISKERYEEAARQFSHISKYGRPNVNDLDQYGLSALIIGRYEEANKAWGRAARLDPANADRYRYGAAFATLARDSGELPISPDGDRSWEEAATEELESILTAQAKLMREIRAEAEPQAPLSPELRDEYFARIGKIRPLFVASGLEYIRRGLNLREAAFFGGYAPLIFHSREWRPLPPKVRKRMTVHDIAAERDRIAKERLEKEAREAQESGDSKKKKAKKKR